MRRLTISVDDDLADAFASQHIHLDHDNCLETAILRGRIDEVRACADGIVSQTGVRTGNVHLVPINVAACSYVQATHRHPVHKRSV
jgi:CopG family nickel-responsive transcriptional regulator